MPNAPCPMVSRLTVSRFPRGHVFGYPCDAASAAAYGRLPEWPKGAVCKTVGSAYVGSNPTPATHVMSQDIEDTANLRVRGVFLWPARSLAGGLVVAVGVEDELAQELAGAGVDDADVQVLDEEQDAGSGVGPADADVVELAVVAEGDESGGVDAVGADAV